MKDAPLLPLSNNAKAADLFLASKTASYSYGDLQCFEDFFMNFIAPYDIGPDRPVGLCASSCDTFVFIIATCWKQGLPFITFNPDSPPNTLQHQGNSPEPALTITDSNTDRHFTGRPTQRIEELALPDILSPDKATALENNRYPADRIFGYFFTSGTSGKPKTVPLKRRQIQYAARASAQNLQPGPDECWLLCMPLYHVGGISVIIRSLIYGSAIYRMDRFNKKETAGKLSRDKTIVAASLVPTMLSRLTDDPDFDTHPGFKAILLGGGPISTELLTACIERDIPVIASYGMTESCAQIAANAIFSKPKDLLSLQSVGSVFKPNLIEIRDNDLQRVKTDTTGTVWIKGPQVFDGYYKDNTQADFDESGWFNTGDFGRLDSKGNLFIEARRSDLIITGGENVSPYEVETLLQGLDFIKEAAVFGVSDKEWGQRVVAAIVCTADKPPPHAHLKKALKQKLPGFKIPKEFIYVQALPRTGTGKIKRSRLKELVK